MSTVFQNLEQLGRVFTVEFVEFDELDDFGD